MSETVLNMPDKFPKFPAGRFFPKASRVFFGSPVLIRPGITTATRTCGAFRRMSLISASVKPFTAYFAAE